MESVSVNGLVQDVNDGSVILHSGHEDKHIHGVALIVSKAKAKNLVRMGTCK